MNDSSNIGTRQDAETRKRYRDNWEKIFRQRLAEEPNPDAAGDTTKCPTRSCPVCNPAKGDDAS